MDDELSFKISADTGDAVNEINALIGALKYLKRNAKTDFGFGNLASQINKFADDTRDSIAPIINLANGLKEIASSLKSIDVNKLRDVGSAVANASGTNTNGNSSDLNGSTEVESGSVTKKIWSATFKDALSNVSQSFDTLKKNMQNYVLPLTQKYGKALYQINKILLYRIVRRAMAEIRKGIQEGLQNVAKYSKLLEGLDSNNANGVLSEFASSLAQLKNTLGSAIIPMLNLMKPIIIGIINGVITLTNQINKLASTINGKDTFTKAKYIWKDYADSIDNATSSAKAYKRTILGIDEINALNGEDSNSTNTSIAEMFEEETIDEPIKTIGEKLKQLFEKVAEVLTPVWEKVKETGENIANWFLSDDFLNALDWVGENMDLIADAVVTIGAIALGGKVVSFFAAIGKEGVAIGLVASGIVTITDALTKLNSGEVTDGALWEYIGGIESLGAGVSLLTKSWIPLLLTTIGGASVSVAGYSKEFRTSMNNLLTWYDEDINKGLSKLQTDLEDSLGVGGSAMLTKLANVGSLVLDELQEQLGGAWTIISDAFFLLGDLLTGQWDRLGIDLLNIGIDIVNLVIGMIQGIVNAFIRGINITIRATNSFIISTVQPLANKVIGAVNSCFKALNELGRIELPDWLQALTGIKSVGFNFKELSLIDISDALPKELEEVNWKIDPMTAETLYGKKASSLTSNSRSALNGNDKLMVSLKANGGFVDAGSLFIAGESGAEVVGNFGGKTGVMNEEQMARAYAMANDGQNKLLKEQNNLLREILNKQSNVTISTSTILEGLERTNRRMGKTVVPIG